jgi:hypothetical protein
MSACRKLYLSACLASALGLILGIPVARPQDPGTAKPATLIEDPSPSDDGWHAALTPYVWFAGVHGDVGVRGHDASVHASFSDIFSDVNIGAMGALEVRYNRIVMPIDFMWIKLSDSKALPFDQGVDSVKTKFNQTMFTPKIGYRFIDAKRFKVDAVFGIRYWHLGNTLTLQPTQPEGGLYESANWVDAVGGAKFEALLTPKIVVTILGDAGGVGAHSDYQVAGLLGLRVRKKIILQAGYRYVDVNYRPSQSTFLYDVAQSGIVLGATINLK